MAGSITRTPCPQCLATGGLYIDDQLVAAPIGDFSLAGGAVKVSAISAPVLQCANCTLRIVGTFDGEGHAIFDQ